MTVPTTLTWSLGTSDGGPARPSVDAMGEASLENDALNAPKAPQMPTAEMLNQWQRQIAAIGGVVPALIVSVRFSGGTPTLYKFAAPTTSLSFTDITVTDGGPGLTTISWPANILPPPVAEPCVSLNGTVSGMPIVGYATTTSILVKTFDGTNSAADRDFTLQIF
jgi:hypothetical protein